VTEVPPKKDATGERTSEAELLREELAREQARRESLEAAFEKLDDAVLVIDSDQVLFANPAVAQLFGISSERLSRMSREQLLREVAGLCDDPPDLLRLLRERSADLDAREDFEIQRPRWRRLRWTGKTLELGRGRGQLVTFSDITQDADLASTRRRQALTDELTDLSNRRAGEQAIAREAARARRTGRPLSFVLFDVDHFKLVNDTHGHATGDRVLREVARYLSAFLRRGDIAVRWGGEEFLVILADELHEAARFFAERVRKAIEILRIEDVGPITISAGVSELMDDESAEEALSRADANLYEAKRTGRNRVV
jgi:diguanylate cyclase (GGDEF)-like protein/PAS domain S-box-containing protein